MKKALTTLTCMLALHLAPALAQGAPGNLPDTTPQVTAPAQVSVNMPPQITLPSTKGVTWYEVAVGIAIPAFTALLGHRFAMRQQKDSADVQRNSAELNSIEIRDESFGKLLAQLTTAMTERESLVAENASNRTQLEIMLKNQTERDVRERELVTKVTALEVQVQAIQSCAGGTPCPFSSGGHR